MAWSKKDYCLYVPCLTGQGAQSTIWVGRFRLEIVTLEELFGGCQCRSHWQRWFWLIWWRHEILCRKKKQNKISFTFSQNSETNWSEMIICSSSSVIFSTLASVHKNNELKIQWPLYAWTIIPVLELRRSSFRRNKVNCQTKQKKVFL